MTNCKLKVRYVVTDKETTANLNKYALNTNAVLNSAIPTEMQSYQTINVLLHNSILSMHHL